MLCEKFDDLYAVLNPEAALAARKQRPAGWRDRRQRADSGAGQQRTPEMTAYAPAGADQRRCDRIPA